MKVSFLGHIIDSKESVGSLLLDSFSDINFNKFTCLVAFVSLAGIDALKEKTGKKPITLITDGLPAYRKAFNKEFRTMRKPRPQHISTIKLRGNMNNNKMERLNGEIRDREKVMRGLKKEDTPILKRYQIYHNYLREHEGLNGKTPSEACGIEIKGNNKWITLIQNASIP